MGIIEIGGVSFCVFEVRKNKRTTMLLLGVFCFCSSCISFFPAIVITGNEKRALVGPSQCYVEFTPKKGHIDNVSLERIHQEIEICIEEGSVTIVEQVSSQRFQEMSPDMPYTLSNDQPIRVVRIGDFPFSPCGVPHGKSLKEWKGLEISKHKIKNNMLKIYDHLNEDYFYEISAH